MILDGNNLRDELPAYIFNHMSRLEVLSLRHNQFSGKITKFTSLDKQNRLDYRYIEEPPWIAMSFLRSLKELWLSHNNFIGAVNGDAIGHLHQLEYLSLSNNRFTGDIPDTLGYLSKLEVLSLGCNQFTGEIPDSMHSLRRLRYLYLHGNLLEEKLPNWIDDFEYLIEFSL